MENTVAQYAVNALDDGDAEARQRERLLLRKGLTQSGCKETRQVDAVVPVTQRCRAFYLQDVEVREMNAEHRAAGLYSMRQHAESVLAERMAPRRDIPA